MSGAFFPAAEIRPQQTRQWLNPPVLDPAERAQRDAQERLVCETYRLAQERELAGIHTVSTDEKTGIQALERVVPDQPLKPGRPVRRENEYIRHGTLCLLACFWVAVGRVIQFLIGPTRTEQDFVRLIRRTLDADPAAAGWIFVADNLNTHQSVGLVRLVARRLKLRVDLGVPRQRGILKSMTSRAAFLADAEHAIRFVYTPKHASWLNQIEIWFSVLARRVIRRGNFTSKADLKQKLEAFIAYFNKTLAQPYRWT